MDNFNITNFLNKTKIKFEKPLSYAQIIKLSSPLPVKKISINEWLIHYGLEAYKKYFNNSNFYKFKYIDHNTDLLRLFGYVDEFFQEIKYIVVLKYGLSINSYKKLIKKKNLKKEEELVINKIREDIYRFLVGFKFLEEQELEYKKLSSALGLNPSHQDYLDLIEKSNMLDFLDSKFYRDMNIYKKEIQDKLKLLDYDDFININNHRFLNKLLSIDIEYLKNFNRCTKDPKNNIKTGLRKNMTDSEYKRFIKNNKLFEYFVSCDNENSIKEIRNELLQYNAEELINTHRVDIFFDVVKPRVPIHLSVSKKIYDYIFPNEEDIFKKQKKDLLESIPKTKYFKSLKPRVFYISSHGVSCDVQSYESRYRLNIENIVKKFNSNLQYNYFDKNNLLLFTSQPIGRYSLFEFFDTFNELLSGDDRILILNSLISATTKEHYDIIQNLFNIYIYKKIGYNKLLFEQTKEKFEKLYKNFVHESKTSKSRSFFFGETEETTSDYINFVRYNYLHPPANIMFSFNVNDEKDSMLGLFELNKDNQLPLSYLNDKIKSEYTKSTPVKMGMDLSKLFENLWDYPKYDLREVLKYNKIIHDLLEKKDPRRPRQYWSYEDFIKIILENANIKKDEYVVIFSNQCRAFTPPINKNQNIKLNSIHYFNKQTQKEITRLRKKSFNESFRKTRQINQMNMATMKEVFSGKKKKSKKGKKQHIKSRKKKKSQIKNK